MKLMLDMNVSPLLAKILSEAGHTAVHWSDVGGAMESDEGIAAWARERRYVVVSNDLDFGKLLAATGDVTPSVVQLRLGRHDPVKMAKLILLGLAQAESELKQGALLTIDHTSHRVRILPIATLKKSH